MITNQRQYLVAQGQAERFRHALAAPAAKGLHPKAARAMTAGLRSQLDDIEAELAEYDALSQGQVTELEAESIVGIGQALIKARIVRNLTQRELAERLSLAEQQVQRYEATLYRGVAAERLQQVADALRLRVREMFTFEPG
jgi:HTH-type transcriptional regulator / antitoxin HigA